MKEFFKDILYDKIARLGLFLSLLFIIISFVFVLIYYNRLPQLIPLFNQLPWGLQRLGATEGIFIPIGLALSILSGNTIAASLIYKKIPLASRILTITSLLVSLITLLFITKVIQLTL